MFQRWVRATVAIAASFAIVIPLAPAASGSPTPDPDRLEQLLPRSLPESLGKVTGIAENAVEALQTATRVLSGKQRASDPEPTLALRALFVSIPALKGEQRRAAERLLARPTDSDNDDSFSYPASATKRYCNSVCLHWTGSGPDATSSSWASATSQELNRVFKHHTRKLGYKQPAQDLGVGGNNKLDVYLGDLPNTIFGYCAPEFQAGARRATAYCVLDNNYTEHGGTPRDLLKVTAAHEVFHAVQFNYDYLETTWLFEATATWMEEVYADGVNDNRSYLRYGQLARPHRPLDASGSDTADLADYGNWLFFQSLQDRYGARIVRRIWEMTSRYDSAFNTWAIHRALRTYTRHSLPNDYQFFCVKNTLPGHSYQEARAWRGLRAPMPLATQIGARTYRGATTLNRMSCQTYLFHREASTRKLKVNVNVPPGHSRAVVIRHLKDGSVTRHQVKAGDGWGSRTVWFGSKVKRIWVVLVNTGRRTSERGEYKVAGILRG